MLLLSWSKPHAVSMTRIIVAAALPLPAIIQFPDMVRSQIPRELSGEVPDQGHTDFKRRACP